MHQNHHKGLCHLGKTNFERESPLHAGVLCIPVSPKRAGPIAHGKERIDHGDIRGPRQVSSPDTMENKKVTHLVHHATNDSSLIYIKPWFEYICPMEQNK